jgi:cardiolipin synthase A/B
VSSQFWYGLAAILVPLASLLASCHALIGKRDHRSALTWVALHWLVPVFGVALYLLFGINRISSKASNLYTNMASSQHNVNHCSRQFLEASLGQDGRHLHALAGAVDRITTRPLLAGNCVEPLINGEEAYPAMLEAIRDACASVTLATYIFGNDNVGQDFADALADANQRGVEVRVLIDNAGERYSWPSMVGALRERGVTVARFFPRFPSGILGMNLRNHRKLLVVDGRIGFTGGMNIRRHHCMDAGSKVTRDVHFRLRGPVVAHLQDMFADDWFFAAGEWLEGDAFFPRLDSAGDVIARGLRGGPDENLLKHRWVLHAAIANANRSIRIMTPYFLPDPTLSNALNLASMQGIAVDIVLPSHSNLPFVHWAMMAQLRDVLDFDCKVWLSPPPFDHGKLMIVDDHWCFIGSSNWDPRSLRLNFEFNVECYDSQLARRLSTIVDRRIAHATPVSLDDLAVMPLHLQLRNGIARLLTPYL